MQWVATIVQTPSSIPHVFDFHPVFVVDREKTFGPPVMCMLRLGTLVIHYELYDIDSTQVEVA